jgi:hypothetical protein
MSKTIQANIDWRQLKDASTQGDGPKGMSAKGVFVDTHLVVVDSGGALVDAGYDASGIPGLGGATWDVMTAAAFNTATSGGTVQGGLSLVFETTSPNNICVWDAANSVWVFFTQGSGGTSGGTFVSHKTITIDHTKVPNTDQSNFPVLVQGTYSYLAGIAYGGSVNSPNGYDIMFTSDSAGLNRLAFERVVYDITTGTVEFRVRVPSVSHTVDTVFYMWYNNSLQSADLSTPNAWDSNFVGVYHFGDGATLGRTDSTIKHNDNPAGNNGGTLCTVTSSGKILGGAAFAGGQGYYIGADASLSPSVFTISGWVYIGASATQAILGATGNGGIEFRVDAGTFTLSLLKEGVANVATSTGAIAATTWKHVAVTYSGTGVCIFYIDGVAVGTSTNLQTFTALGKYLGASHNVEDLSNGSKLDEVHISNIVRSADWIATEYNNSNSPSTFYTVT